MVGALTHLFSQTSVTSNSSVAEPSDWNKVHFIPQQFGGNIVGPNQILATNIVLAGGNNITLSATTDASSNATLSIISAPNTLSSYRVTAGGFLTADNWLGGDFGNLLPTGAMWLDEFVLPQALALSRIDVMGVGASNLAGAAGVLDGLCIGFWSSTSSRASYTTQLSATTGMSAILYSRGTGSSTGSAFLVTSNSFLLSAIVKVSDTHTSGAPLASASATFSWSCPVGLNGNAYSTSSFTQTASGGAHTLNNGASSIGVLSTTNANWNIGNKLIYFPMSTTLIPGTYYLGLSWSNAGTGTTNPTFFSTGGGAGFFFNAGIIGPQLMPWQNNPATSSSFCQFGTTTPVYAAGQMGLSWTGNTSSTASSLAVSDMVPNFSFGQFPANLVGYATNVGE